MKILYIIPARSGSKVIREKNLKLLHGKPLIQYTFQLARKVAEDQDICLSTDHSAIIELARLSGLPVLFTRPKELADDTADMYDVIMHAINQYEAHGRSYDCIMLLQPTSPFRTTADVHKAVSLYNDSIDMVVSVKKAEWNPEALFYENENGFLEKFTTNHIQRRQDLSSYYSYNGVLYLMNVNSLRAQHFLDFKKIIKMEMDEYRSVDLDTIFDWEFAEYLLEKKIVVIE